MAIKAHHLEIVPETELLPTTPYLEAIEQTEIYGHMGRHNQDRDILITPANVALFGINQFATAQDLIENKPELTYISTSLIVNVLEGIKDARRARPNLPTRPLAFFMMNGQFVDQATLKDIKQPAPHAIPHQKHTAFFEITTEEGETEDLPPIPVGQIYTYALALPRQKPALRAV